MITGMPLSGIGLLRQCELELSAQAQAVRRTIAGPSMTVFEIERPVEPASRREGHAETETRRVDVLV